MDAAAIAVARAANVAKYGGAHEKEAQGLRLIARALQEDGHLTLHKSFEGARADFCVYKPGAPALGIQLKTTGGNLVDGRTGYEYIRFGHTDGYDGLLIVLVALHLEPPGIWLAEGIKVVSTTVQVAVQSRRETKTDRLLEVNLATVAKAIHAIYVEAMSGSSNYVLRSPIDHEKPTAPTRLAEYNAFKRLERSLPVLFMDPPAEHMSHDYVVDGKKWQLKLAHHLTKFDRYHVTCNKQAGSVGGKQTIRQYEVDDFDFLCIQLPEDTVDCCYLIPQGILAEHGLVGNAAKSAGHVYMYPHRLLTTRKFVHTAGVHWTEAYRINFAEDPLAQLARIMGA